MSRWCSPANARGSSSCGELIFARRHAHAVDVRRTRAAPPGGAPRRQRDRVPREREPRARWPTTALKVLDWRRRVESTVATKVVAATALAWADDGRALAVLAALGSRREPAGLPRRHSHCARATRRGKRLQRRHRCTGRCRPRHADYVVEIGRLFDGVRGTYQRHVDLHVRGGRIAAIVPRGVLPATGEIIDARDSTVIPGLIDLHAHQSSLVGERLGRAWLAYGVTTVRELAAAPREAVERAESWASGRSARAASAAVAEPRGLGGCTRPRCSLTRASPMASRTVCKRQMREIAVPAWESGVFPPRLSAEVDAPSLELELSPGFTAYQDGFSRLIAAETTLVTGLAALAGLHGWPSAAAAQRCGVHGTVHTCRASGLGATGLARRRSPALRADDRAARPRPAAASASARTPRLFPMGSASTSSSRCWRVPASRNDQVLRMATAEGALALGPRAADRHARRRQARGLRGPRRRPVGAHRRYADDRRRREGRCLA